MAFLHANAGGAMARETSLGLDFKFWLFVIGAIAIRLPLLSSYGLHPDEQTFLNVGHDAPPR